MERVGIPRVFIGKTPLSDDQIATIESDRKVPTQNSTTPYEWKQVYTLGDVIVRKTKETTETRNDQIGKIKEYIKDEIMEIEIPFSRADYEVIKDYVMLDRESVGTEAEAIPLRNERGYDLSEKAVSLFIYSKAYDPSNTSDIPDVDADPQSYVIYKAYAKGDYEDIFNEDQKVIKVVFGVIPAGSNQRWGMFGSFIEAD